MRLFLAGAAVGAFGLAILLLSGLPTFTADGDGPVDWLFHMAARQSVSLRSATLEVPPLDDPAMIRRGAGHYELVCATCHGSPVRPADAIAQNMSPRPPLLVDQMGKWRPPERVFWTVKHGIARSAMPAWPTDLRDDEVWAVVAFLEQLPQLDATAYEELVGPSDMPVCARCHGEDGAGYGGMFPRLDIQSPTYLADALRAFRQGTRASGTMMAAARSLSDEAITELSDYYGKFVPQPNGGDGRAAEIARRGIPERDVPACNSCHGDGARRDYPRLSGQSPAYLLGQLQLFAAHGAARGGPYAPIMAEVARNLTPDEMAGLADWYGR